MFFNTNYLHGMYTNILQQFPAIRLLNHIFYNVSFIHQPRICLTDNEKFSRRLQDYNPIPKCPSLLLDVFPWASLLSTSSSFLEDIRRKGKTWLLRVGGKEWQTCYIPFLGA